MALGNTWTQADYDSLKASVATGVLSVRYDGPPGRTIVYQSLAEMRSLLAEMQVSLQTAADTYSPYRLIGTNKGL